MTTAASRPGDLAPAPTSVESAASRVFPRQASAAAQARRFVTEAIGAHPARETAELLAGELISNAVLHAGEGETVSVAVAVSAASIRLDVWDCGHSGIPRWRAPGSEEESGRGLQLVNRLAWRWGFTREPGRTCCWAEIVPEEPEE